MDIYMDLLQWDLKMNSETKNRLKNHPKPIMKNTLLPYRQYVGC